MQLSEVIRHLAGVLSQPLLTPNAQGACAFVVNGVAISLIPRPGEAAFVCRAPLGQLRRDADGNGDLDADTIERLLAANLFALGAGGAAVVIDARAHVFLTQHFHEEGLSFPVFLKWLERFVHRAASYQGWLAPVAAELAP